MKILGTRFPAKGGCEVTIQVGDLKGIAYVDQNIVAATGPRVIPTLLSAISTKAMELQREIDQRDAARGGPDQSPTEE